MSPVAFYAVGFVCGVLAGLATWLSGSGSPLMSTLVATGSYSVGALVGVYWRAD